MTPKVVLVPFPLTPLAAFGYFLLQRLGMIAPDAAVRYHGSPGTKSTAIVLGNGAVLNIASLDLSAYLTSLLDRSPSEDWLWLKRYLTYSQSGDPKRGHRLRRWLLEHAIAAHDPGDILRAATELFVAWLADGVDPWRSDFQLPEPCDGEPSPLYAWPLDRRIVTLPILKSDEPGEREVTDVATFTLQEGRVRALQGAHICIGIGGPKGSGKSTLAASLAREMRNEVASLKSRAGWENFSLTTEAVNVDFATPTVDAIAAGKAKGGRDSLRAQKRPWTELLALEALAALVAAKSEVNIVLADLPGAITPITEIVAAPADAIILITRDWSLMSPWQDFAVKRMGLEFVAQARSRSSLPEPRPILMEAWHLLRRLTGKPADDGVAFASMLKQHQPGRMVSGRVVDLDRVVRPWDPYVGPAGEFLLFDILPAFVMRRQERLRRDLREIAHP